jgi:hypothetical protein
VSGDDPTAAGVRAHSPASAPIARVARYVLLDRLGEGGMGVVWSAYDPELDRRIAVKLIRGEADAEARQRFVREARAMAQLHHPSIVAIHDVGTSDEHAYIAMELVRGVTLRDWLRDASRGWRSVLATFLQAGDGIAMAHRAGVVHRDFKPANVMVAEDGRAVVLDFGLARAPTSAGDEGGAPIEAGAWASVDITHTAGVVGTPAYMAPEQIAGAAFDGRADQFSFCVAAYEALFGVAPFPRDSLPAMVGAMARNTVATPTTTQRVPTRIRKALLRGLLYDPVARWPDMDALLAELRRDRGRASLIAVGGALAIGVIAFAATRQGPTDPCAAKDAEVAALWTADRRAQVDRVAQQIERDGSTVAELDAYVARLRGAVAQSCAASRDAAVDPVAQGRVGVCLDAAQSELDGLLHVLTAEGTAATDALAAAAWSLPDPTACTAVADEDATTDAVVAADVRQLALAESWLVAGDPDRADEVLAPLLDASELRSPGWRSRVLRIAGKLALARADLDRGRAMLEQAAGLALEGGDDLSFVRSSIDLAHQIGVRAGDFERGEVWLDLGMAAARRLGGGPLLQAALLETRGTLRQLDRDFEGSVLAHSAALAITLAAVGPDHRLTGEVIGELSITLLMDSRHEIALPLLIEARRILEAARGPTHESVLRVRTNTLTALTNLARLDEAEREANALLLLLDAPAGSEPLSLASALTGLAEVAEARDQVALAIPLYERVRVVCERHGARLRAAAVRAHLASLYSQVGRHADAEVAITTGRSEALAAGLAPDHSYLAEFDMYAADIATAAGDHARAHALLDALAESTSRSPENQLTLRLRVARLALKEGKPGDHAAFLREGIEHPLFRWDDRVEALLLIADLERLAGREAAAAEAITQARREVGDRDAPKLLREIEERR